MSLFVLFSFSFSLSVNAITADGSKHAQMDETTAKGRDPREVRFRDRNMSSVCLVLVLLSTSFRVQQAGGAGLPPALRRRSLQKYFVNGFGLYCIGACRRVGYSSALSKLV